MSQPLSPRRKFRKNSRGISSLIAAIFMVIIILFMSFNVFTFTLFKNTQFRDAVDDLNQMDMEQKYEKISFAEVSFVPEDNYVLVQAQLQNDGPSSVRLVTLWVIHDATEKYGYASQLKRDAEEDLDLVLAVGEPYVFQESVLIEELGSAGGFTAWFITARGNRIPIEDKVVYAEVSQGMGSLVLDFDNFRYFTYPKPPDGTLLNYPDGTISFDVPIGTPVAFGVYLKNEDPKKRTIILDSHSQFWDAARDKGWFIINVNDDPLDPEYGAVQEGYEDITLGYGQRKMLVFASKFDLGSGSFDELNTPSTEGNAATFLVLHGTLGSGSFAQNIPFVSLFYYDPT